MGPNNSVVILDIFPIGKRKEIGRSLKRRLEKSNLEQLHQSLIVVDLKTLLESIDQDSPRTNKIKQRFNFDPFRLQ